MGFRPDLDLKQILRDYEYFGGTPRLRQIEPEGPVYPSVFDTYAPAAQSDEPVRAGYGPTWCSSETALDVSPRICWDVNGYYRGLGVHWRASRKELAEAFLRKRGHDDVWLTYVLTQLLNPEVRMEYDRCPPGEPFLNDDFVQLAIKRRAHNEAYRRTMSGDATHRNDVLEEWGLRAVKVDDAGEVEHVDSDPEVRQDEPAFSQGNWEYSFYLWRTIESSPASLRRWQELLLRELSDFRSTVRFSVGMIGKETAPYVVHSHEEDFIIFLNENHLPTPELAAQVVTKLKFPLTAPS